MSLIIIFAKEVARFVDMFYLFEVESDANGEYYICNVKKKNKEAITGSVTLSFKVIK